MRNRKPHARREAAMGGVREEVVAEVAMDTISNPACAAVKREVEEDWGR